MNNAQQPLNALPQGHRLQEYELVRVLGFGGFGMTYLGFDHNLDKAVAIKEYLPSDIATRTGDNSVVPQASQFQDDFKWGLDRFLDEARALARFDHRHIIKVHRFFEAHGTAYIVMEYAEGETLSAFLERKGTLKEAELKAILYPILDGLEVVHGADFLHRDIKPGNIIIRDEDNSPVLLDFGSARQAVGVRSRSVTSIITPGYAPIEQYSSRGDQGPWTDIYALGGVCYRALTGEVPDDATDRMRNDPLIPVVEQCAGQVSAGFLSAIDWALRVDEGNRPQSVGAWRVALEKETPSNMDVDPSAITSVTAPPSEIQDRGQVDIPPIHQRAEDRSKLVKKPKGKLFAAVACLFVLLIGGGYYYQAEWARQGVDRKFRDCTKCPEMVVVPSGSFTMGSPSGERGSDDEGPRHAVRIDYRFAVGVYEVTFAEWDACADAGGCDRYVPDDEGWGRGNRPVINVSWENAQSYVRWLSAKTGHNYGLLSESEWEYVARAGTTTAYSWGDNIGRNRANCRGCGSRWDIVKTAPVGSFSANGWGVYDMHGNVWEWVEDCYNDSYVGAPSDGSAWKFGNCSVRVKRGGSWLNAPRDLRSANRGWNASGEIRGSYIGFRVVRRF